MFSRAPSKLNTIEEPWHIRLLKCQVGLQNLQTSDANGNPETIAETTADQMSDDDPEFTNRIKARFRRRLQDRWFCKVPNHTYCFTNHDGVHISLNADAMETWALALHNGEATLLIPPGGIISSSPDSTGSDTISICSGRTIQYQRQILWRSNPSLTDLRSMQITLRDSWNSSSTSALSWSTVSSGNPGIGYLSGKWIKWVGMRILDAIAAVMIRKRCRIMRTIVRKLGSIPADQRAGWIFMKRFELGQTIEDILELSATFYKTIYRRTAIEQGFKLRELIDATDTSGNSPITPGWFSVVSSMRVKSFPLYLLANEHLESLRFTNDLRETLLQDLPEPDGDEPLMAELVARLCNELAYGDPSPWRYQGYRALWAVYYAPYGRQCLLNLARNGVLIGDLATRAFKTATQDVVEHARAIDFFVPLANDMPLFRKYLFASTGIPLLLANIMHFEETGRLHSSMMETSAALANVSRFFWGLCALPVGVCFILVKLLVRVSQCKTAFTGKGETVEFIILALRNFAIRTYNGRQAILDATTEEARQVLPELADIARGGRGDSAARSTQNSIDQIWQ